jgi:hypothetical protein
VNQHWIRAEWSRFLDPGSGLKAVQGGAVFAHPPAEVRPFTEGFCFENGVLDFCLKML